MPKSFKRRGVVLLPGLCDGCGRCVKACEKVVSKGLKKGAKKAALIKVLKRGHLYFPVMCRNCQDAPCVTACMTGCRRQAKEGLVITDYSRCVGCWMCIMNCPFGAIVRDEEDHIARKCEGCTDRETAPCVAACTMGILSHSDVKQFSAMTRMQSAERFLSACTVDADQCKGLD